MKEQAEAYATVLGKLMGVSFETAQHPDGSHYRIYTTDFSPNQACAWEEYLKSKTINTIANGTKPKEPCYLVIEIDDAFPTQTLTAFRDSKPVLYCNEDRLDQKLNPQYVQESNPIVQGRNL